MADAAAPAASGGPAADPAAVALAPAPDPTVVEDEDATFVLAWACLLTLTWVWSIGCVVDVRKLFTACMLIGTCSGCDAHGVQCAASVT